MTDVSQIFTSVNILPNYVQGFTFLWSISQGFDDPLPWKFTVYQGHTSEGPWEAISPEQINKFAWSEDEKRVVGMDLVLFFKVILITPRGVYESYVRTPYGDLERRAYMIVRDIMRRELLQMKKLSGVPVLILSRSVYGPKCTNCLDPITGDNLTSNCSLCYGTGRQPGYHGPYDMWATFSPLQRDTEQSPDGTGVRQNYAVQVRLLGFPYVKDQDILIDVREGKRYIVDGVVHLTEIRRVTVVQQFNARELPVTDPLYRIDLPDTGEGCTLPQ